MAALAHMTDEDLKAIGIPMVNSLKLLTLICLFNFLFLLLMIFWLKIVLGLLTGYEKKNEVYRLECFIASQGRLLFRLHR